MKNILENMLGISNLGQSEINIESFPALPVHIHYKDMKGRYIDCNPHTFQQAGFSNQKDLLGLEERDFCFLSPNEIAHIRHCDKLVRTTGKSHFFIDHFTIFDGTKYVGFTYKTPLRSCTEKIIGSIALTLAVKSQEVIEFDDSIYSTFNKLSKRQMDCLYYLVRGMTVKQIARCIHLSPKTVENYIHAIKVKLDCYSRSELIAKALKIKEIRENL